MKLVRCLILVALSVALLVFSGCGDDDAPAVTATTATTGQQLYAQNCQACHTAASISFVTVPIIKQYDMTIGLNDAQLQTLVDYLKTATTTDPGASGGSSSVYDKLWVMPYRSIAHRHYPDGDQGSQHVDGFE